ncbi:hypothetical protein H4582DRAFT_2094395 [Lactarius indigo]|nr:hypothetical protein H4582DRAFT_2094395 [Lactarius indigo]
MSGDFDTMRFYINTGVLSPTVSSPGVIVILPLCTTNSDTLTGLPTELIVRIFAYLPLEDLLSVQHTCHKFHDVISGSASLEYFLRTEINLLEDLLPLDLSLRDRVAFLRHHETAWNNLQLNEFTRLTTNEVSQARYILQDGYLIYKAVTNAAQYGYIGPLFEFRPAKCGATLDSHLVRGSSPTL